MVITFLFEKFYHTTPKLCESLSSAIEKEEISTSLAGHLGSSVMDINFYDARYHMNKIILQMINIYRRDASHAKMNCVP